VVVYELDGPPLAFWDFAYPPTLVGDTVHLPGVAVADDEGPAIEVGRTIERDAFKPGVVLRTRDIAKGRGLLIEDERGRLARAVIKAEPTLDPAGAAPGQFCHLVLPVAVDGTLSQESASAVLLGNVAAASHGETVRDEVVGNGDAAARFQRMALRKKPLTYLPAGGAEAIASTLQLRVGGVRWLEVPGLFGRAPTETVYEARPADDGSTVLQFGDGVTGAALPTGRGNVVATYRVGVGLGGRVAAGALTTLLAKPPGLSAARNPAPAEGGADPETVDTARENAPRTVRTFGRAVSLLDFEDTVTASGEVAKALATWVWDGLDRAIHLTIAGQEGATFSPTARRSLGTNLDSVRDPNHRLLIDNYAKVPIAIRAGVAADPAHDPDVVLAAAHAAVVEALSFARLGLGQSLHLSDLFRVVQDVPGVLFVDVDEFLFKKPATLPPILFPLYVALRGGTLLPGGAPAPVQGHLRIFSARPHPSLRGVVQPAELAILESPSLDVLIEPRQP
jgi:predicted phage baseplate assembly protein